MASCVDWIVRNDRRSAILWAGTLGVATLVASTYPSSVPKLVWNASASAPIGFYWVEPKTEVEPGDLVLAWLPDDARRLAAERRYLPANVPLVKRVAAMAGDRVCSTGRDISINGNIVTRRLLADREGRSMPRWEGCRILKGSEVFLLMARVPDSFDGRYFGPITTDRIIGRLVPLWTR